MLRFRNGITTEESNGEISSVFSDFSVKESCTEVILRLVRVVKFRRYHAEEDPAQHAEQQLTAIPRGTELQPALELPS